MLGVSGRCGTANGRIWSFGRDQAGWWIKCSSCFYPRVFWHQTSSLISFWHEFGRDSIGSSSVIGDKRWAGTYGVDADFVAKTHCSVEFISTETVDVSYISTLVGRACFLFTFSLHLTVFEVPYAMPYALLHNLWSSASYKAWAHRLQYVFQSEPVWCVAVTSKMLGWGRRC